MPEDQQIQIPASFELVHRDERGRLCLPRDVFYSRYELCEDMAQLLVERSQEQMHALGLTEDIVLGRTEAGLADPASGFSPAEARWVSTRLAELLGWPWQHLPTPTAAAATAATSGKRHRQR